MIQEKSYTPIEVKVYHLLESGPGVPRLHASGITDDAQVLYIATDLLGPNLDDLHRLCKRRFSIKTTLMIFDQVLITIEHLHKKRYAHRGLHPKNLVFGLGQLSNTLHSCDFHLARSLVS